MATIKKTQLPIRIREVRMKMGLSQKEFAEQAGLTQGQISHMELGKNFPGLETMIDICSACGLTLAEFIDETPPNLRPPAPPTRAQKAIWILQEMQFTRPVIDRIRIVLSGYDGTV